MKLTFRKKLFLGFFGFAIVLGGLVIVLVYSQVGGIPIEVTRALLRTAVANAVQRIDPADVAAIPDGPDARNSAAFKKLHEILVQVDRAPPHFGPKGRRVERNGIEKDIYILIRTDRPHWGKLLVTIRPEESGQTYDMGRFPAMMRGWDGLSADEEVASDEYGRSLSAYAPIRDPEGAPVALLGIDAPGEYIDQFERGIIVTAVTIFLVGLVVSLVPALYLSWRLNRPIRLLREGMERLAAGDLKTPLATMRTRDEFESLIKQFNRMLAGLRERDTLKRSLEIAMEVQQHLLPQSSPALEGFDIAGASDYCDETGGDYYDFIELLELGPSKLGVAVGDVTGHGIGAALLMADARGVIRSHAGRFADRLDELFETINVHLVRDTGEERFMTLFYGVLDGKDRSLIWASGGHDPSLWRHARDGKIEELPNTGIPLGILEDVSYGRGGPIFLEPGDLVVIGTDGIWEAQNPSEETFGKDRLKEVLARCAEKSAADIRATVVEAVRNFCGEATQEDDITLVVIKAV